MTSSQTIRLSDWRDQALIRQVREHLKADLEGDLYEMLTWATYHVHSVWEVPPGVTGPTRWEHGEIVAYGTVALCADGVAEATEMVVLPSHRRQGLASRLRMAQVRDLEVMGFPVLCQAAKTDEGRAWCDTHMERLGELPDTSTYYRGPTSLMRARLKARGVGPAYQLFDDRVEILQRKAKRAWAHLELLGRVAATQRAKVALRSA